MSARKTHKASRDAALLGIEGVLIVPNYVDEETEAELLSTVAGKRSRTFRASPAAPSGVPTDEDYLVMTEAMISVASRVPGVAVFFDLLTASEFSPGAWAPLLPRRFLRHYHVIGAGQGVSPAWESHSAFGDVMCHLCLAAGKPVPSCFCVCAFMNTSRCVCVC